MKYKNYFAWRTSDLREENGVMVGSDITQEWLLPWWWERFRKHNSYPVAFIDFGMSFEMKDWCKERGELIPLRIFGDFIKEKEEMDPQVAQFIEQEFGKHFWSCRNVWFKKPFACLQSPFQKTIWIDIDCEIRGSVEKLFEYVDKATDIGMVKDPCPCLAAYDYPIYNSGVIVFQRNQELIIDWARQCFEQNHAFRGDQEIFSQLIADRKISICEIPSIFNHSRTEKDDPNVIIFHWHGVYGKRIIRNQINSEELSFKNSV